VTASVVRRALRESDAGRFTSGLFNLTAAGSTSRFGFAEAIVQQAAQRPGGLWRRPTLQPISSKDYPVPATPPQNSCLTSERLRARFGITLPDWQDMLARCMADADLLDAG